MSAKRLTWTWHRDIFDVDGIVLRISLDGKHIISVIRKPDNNFWLLINIGENSGPHRCSIRNCAGRMRETYARLLAKSYADVT